MGGYRACFLTNCREMQSWIRKSLSGGRISTVGTGTKHKMALMLCAEKVAQCKPGNHHKFGNFTLSFGRLRLFFLISQSDHRFLALSLPTFITMQYIYYNVVNGLASSFALSDGFSVTIVTIGSLRAATTATATKTSLENKHFGNADYFVIIASSSHPLLFTEHAASGLVEVPLN